MATPGNTSPSGVFIAEDFRDNLIIDRYDPLFTRMRGSKRSHMHSVNSEDVLTWNVFRSLRQVAPSLWLPWLSFVGVGRELRCANHEVALDLWVSVGAPPALMRFQKDEGESEVDVVIQTPDFVWFIEAKYHSDISPGTTSNAERDQVLRNLDVGSYWAGARDFYFSLLVLDAEGSKGVVKLRKYAAPDCNLGSVLQHRPGGLRNFQGANVLLWSDLATALSLCKASKREDEQGYAARALEWLAKRDIRPSGQAA